MDAKISCAHGKMRQGDLDMQWSSDHVRDHDEDEAFPRGRYRAVDHAVSKPCPEEDHAGDLNPALPPCRTLLWSKAKKQILPRQTVEIEAAHGQYRIVQIVLILDGPSSDKVEIHDSIIVCAAEGVEKAVGYCKEWHKLDIWVVFGRVRDDVMDIMTALPPTHRKTSTEIRGKNGNACVDKVVMCNAHVTSIMGDESELVPEETEEYCRETVVGVVK